MSKICIPSLVNAGSVKESAERVAVGIICDECQISSPEHREGVSTPSTYLCQGLGTETFLSVILQSLKSEQ